MIKLDPVLVKKFKEELNEDLNERYDGDYSTWSEVVRDCPSCTMENLWDKVPTDDDTIEAYGKMIDEEIRRMEPKE